MRKRDKFYQFICDYFKCCSNDKDVIIENGFVRDFQIFGNKTLYNNDKRTIKTTLTRNQILLQIFFRVKTPSNVNRYLFGI